MQQGSSHHPFFMFPKLYIFAPPPPSPPPPPPVKMSDETCVLKLKLISLLPSEAQGVGVIVIASKIFIDAHAYVA